MKIYPLYVLCLLPFAANFAHAGDKKPNVIVILSDDQGWGDFSINGNKNLKTPNLDGLARRGAMFDRFYVQPVCAPTRAEFLTGRYHPRGGVRGVSTGLERLNLNEITIAQILRARRLSYRLRWQMAQRQSMAVPSQRPRLRGILRLHLRPLGRIFRSAARAQRQTRPRQGLHRRRFHRQGHRLH